MSYSGTVHCRNCYGKGHNRRSCPDLTESYKKRAQHEIDAGESATDGYWQREYAKRSGVWLHNGEKATELKRNRSGGTRRCKYCAKTGHNTRTCEELKGAKAEAITETRRVRAAIAENLQTVGLGIGALVVRGEGESRIGYMVKGFNWDHINCENITHNPNVVQIEVLNPTTVNSWNREAQIPLPPIEGINDNSWNTNTQLVGPVSGSAVQAIVPEGWVDNQDFLKGMFEDRQSPNWHDNRYDY
tara:strand:- start:490 stop:1221 length:732 start_codon:yes stop_codon:yes gene_type:complete